MIIHVPETNCLLLEHPILYLLDDYLGTFIWAFVVLIIGLAFAAAHAGSFEDEKASGPSDQPGQQ